MKRISLRLMIALATFFISIGIVALWFFNRLNSVAEVKPKSQDCYPRYIDNFNKGAYKGILTRRVYTPDTNRSIKRASDEEASAEETANLFKRFREAPLTIPAACVDESYRLTWIATFHAPTVIRIWRSDDKYFIVIKRLNGKSGYELGELEIEQNRSLSVEEWQSFKTLLYQASYWKMSSTIEEPGPNDGASWIFEGFSDGDFHSVFRIAPSDDLRQIFKKLFDLAGVETEYERYLQPQVPPSKSVNERRRERRSL